MEFDRATLQRVCNAYLPRPAVSGIYRFSCIPRATRRINGNVLLAHLSNTFSGKIRSPVQSAARSFSRRSTTAFVATTRHQRV